MQAFLAELSAAVIPLMLSLFSTILTVVITQAAVAAKQRWGIEVEARHREALHSALMSGISAALTRGLTGNAAVTAAIDHAMKSVPDALVALKPSAQVLTSIAESKLEQASPGLSARTVELIKGEILGVTD